MCNLTTNFNFDNNQVRTLLINNKPYFCLKDVCDILELKDFRVVRLEKDGVILNHIIDNLGREQQANFINEPNLYRVIFRSDKQEAKQFQNWVFEEVLPQLRKTGKYEIANNFNKQNKNNVKKISINEIDLKDFNNYQYFYMNDILLSFPYFRYKINQDTGLPLINIDDYVKCVGFRSYSLYLLEKDNKNKETIEFKKIYDITCNKLMKEYLEDFRERFKKASELKILEDLSNPCIIEDEREYNSTLYIEDYKNLIGTERLYTATEIGSVLGISSLMVGKIANKLKLKNEKFGAWFKDKASHSIKEVQTFKYNKNVINELKEYLKLNNANTLTI